MYCRYCGTSIADDSTFCSNCGKNLVETTQNTIQITNDVSPEINQAETEWYYKGDFDKAGPLSWAEMETRICRRQLDFDGEVKSGLEGEWIPIRQSQFSTIINSLPKEEVSIPDRWIWCLAIIPLIVDILLQQTGIIQNMSYLQWIIPIAFNLLFIRLDINELTGVKMYAESWMYMGIILVPVYLLVREIKTNHNFSPFIIWCFLFAVGTFIL